MDHQRFFVAKTYVTESKAADGFNETGWRVFVVKGDGTVAQLDDYYDSEEAAVQGAVEAIYGWQTGCDRARYDV